MKLVSRILALLAFALLGSVSIAPAIAETSTLMSTQNADAVAITGGTIDGVTLGATTALPALTATALTVSTLQVNTSSTNSGTSQAATLYGGGTSSTNASLQAPTVSSAVNEVVVSGAATAGVPSIVVGGASSDSNPNLAVAAKGTGSVLIGGTTTTLAGLQVPAVAAQVNDVIVTGTITAGTPSITVGGAGSDANPNLSVAAKGTGLVLLGQAICTASGSTPQTCNGQRGIVTTNSLSTAAATDASFTINDSSVTSSSLIECTDQAYSGTLVTNGYPVIMTCVPGSGSFVVHITNTHSANALAGTLKIGFAVLN